MTTLRDAIATLLQDPLDVVLARSILGTADVETIASRVEGFVRAQLGRSVAACSTFTQSVGAVFDLDLDGGGRVVLKAHPVGAAAPRPVSLEELEAVYQVQAGLAGAGFPCARVLVAPRAWPGGAAAIMSFVGVPHADDPHTPAVRRAMAEGLARTVDLGRGFDATRLCREELPAASLFPPPHNALFDLGAPGGDWIDARARAARSVLDGLPERAVVMHGDFSGANVLVSNDEIAAVYDMDSVVFMDEMQCLARTAVHFTYRGDLRWTLPTRDEAIAFVEDYVAARGRSLDRAEKARLDAAAIYAMAYTARCEHGLRMENGEMCAALPAAPDAYFG